MKLAVAERIEDDQAKEILSTVLISKSFILTRLLITNIFSIAMGTANPAIGAMLLELCVTELEDTASSTHSLSYTPRPVVQESSHPYIDDVTLRGKILFFLLRFYK